MLNNKLNITDEVELSKIEEKITKLKALELYDSGKINNIEVDTFKGLAEIHKYLFDDIYDFAGKIRTVNIAKGNFRFASVLYLKDILKTIDEMPEYNYNNIIKKYINTKAIAIGIISSARAIISASISFPPSSASFSFSNCSFSWSFSSSDLRLNPPNNLSVIVGISMVYSSPA